LNEFKSIAKSLEKVDVSELRSVPWNRRWDVEFPSALNPFEPREKLAGRFSIIPVCSVKLELAGTVLNSKLVPSRVTFNANGISKITSPDIILKSVHRKLKVLKVTPILVPPPNAR